MTHLDLSLLGPFRAQCDGQPLGGFASEKARALLAYLAVEARQPHRREALAALLWPERAAASARANLSQALYNLRSILGDRASAEAGAAAQSYLLVSSETIQLNPASAHRVDVTAFADLLRACAEHPHHALEECDDCALRLRDAVDLYQGDLLADLAIGDSAPFEEWATVRREQLHRQALDALHHLAVFHEARGEPELGLAYAWRLVELDAWREEGQRLLMRLLARAGQRSAALAQYLACRRQLSEELGVEPAPETTSLYEQIRQGLVSAIPPPPLPPPQHGEPVSIPDRPPFVAREQELAHLGQWLTQALRGEGRVGFVVGEPGSGKTLLVHEFARQAMAVHPDLIVAYGNCNAYTGVGDPYLPFLEILGLLTGDFDGRLASGALTREHSHRLQGLLPAAAQALVNVGPNLINLFVPGEGLLVRAQALGVTDTPWQARLDELAHRQLAPAMLSQTTLFEEYVRVLHALAPLHPLLLIVDDLQWADAGSANLLFHLGRKLAGHRILVLGAYRAEEVALGREGRQHPLEPVVNEFQRTWGDTRLDLAQADAEGLVAQLIAREPNRLGAGFREALYRHTGGHALFTAELLRGMRERGNLQRDPAGCWVEGPSLDWEMLPARVEAVIAQHMARLPQEDRALLEAASVEGEEFTAEVVARVRGMAEGEVIQRLSGSLSKQHRLVMPISLQRLGEQCLSRYRFRHILFQRYLYQHLDEVERMHLHGEVGNALEERYNAISDMPPGAPRSLSDLGNLYGARVAEVSPILPQLARQFGAAGVARKAVAYYTQAMLRAVNALATLEAITLAAQGLRILGALPDSPDRALAELWFQMVLGKMHETSEGPASRERYAAYARARDLAGQVGNVVTWITSTLTLADSLSHRAEHHEALRLLEEAMEVAQREAPSEVPMVYTHMVVSLNIAGRYAEARRYLELLAEPILQGLPLGSHWGVLHALGIGALSTWVLGYPDRALRLAQTARALATLPQQVVLLGACELWLHLLRRETEAVLAGAEALMPYTTVERYAIARHWIGEHLGWAHAHTGLALQGIAEMRAADAAQRQSGHLGRLPKRLAALAEGYALAGQFDAGLRTVAEALEQIERADERGSEPELHRLKGELLRQRGDDPEEVEACYRQAIAVAQAQEAKSWELRATTSLARLLRDKGRAAEAREMLAAIYGWFTEGFGTLDLVEARELLEQLAE